MPPGIPSTLASILKNSGRLGDIFANPQRFLDQVATILNNLGRVELMRGNLPAAEGYFDEALAMDRKLLQPNHEDLILPLNSMAMLRLAGGKPDAAESLLNEALRIAQPRKHWMLNQVLGNFADLYQATARSREAGEALTLARESMASTRISFTSRTTDAS